MEDMDDIVHEFLVESRENLDQLDSDLVALETTPGSRELLGSIFRTIHTIKGTSGFLAFGHLERLTHAGENLLVELRDGRREMDVRTTNVLLRMVDTVRALLDSIQAGSGEAGADIDPVVSALELVLAGADEPVAAVVPEPVVEPEPEAVAAAASSPKRVRVKRARAATSGADKPAAGGSDDESGSAVDTMSSDVPPEPAEQLKDVVPSPHHPVAESTRPAPTPPVAEPARPSLESAATAAPAKSAADPEVTRASSDTIRVDVDLLDALMRQVSELVLARNAISRLADGGDVDLTRASQRLSLIASELQEGVMKTRMQPIEHVWTKVPRMVRDLSAACGRQVRLEMIGGDTELDRSLLEAVKDPLTHLIRNAIDHGIEAPETRTAAGKAAQGVLSLRAYHAGGQVVVEVGDDGKGIDPTKVAAKAVVSGVRTEAQVATMAPADLLQLLFLPGFSTAEAVTNVSGRGVGMDVVRTKIEAIGGTVDVDSVLGKGTTWRLRIPLTLAIMPAVTVLCDGHTYAIPQVSLLELVALDAETQGQAIEYVRSAAVYRLRGELLPLVDLREVFGRSARTESRSVIAVLQADTVRFGLLVDTVSNTEEIVVKPLSGRLKSIGMYAGATLMGDGQVALILDVQGLARRSLAAESVDHARASQAAEAAVVHEQVQVLVAGIGGSRRVAIPLSAVTRLERFPNSVLEHVGAREVMQYRGSITPVVRLDRLLGSSPEIRDEIIVVVYSRGARSVAIVVDEIVDIVDDHAGAHSELGDLGLVGSTVLKDRVTELLDVEAAVAMADPSFFDDAAVLLDNDLVGV